MYVLVPKYWIIGVAGLATNVAPGLTGGIGTQLHGYDYDYDA